VLSEPGVAPRIELEVDRPSGREVVEEKSTVRPP